MVLSGVDIYFLYLHLKERRTYNSQVEEEKEIIEGNASWKVKKEIAKGHPPTQCLLAGLGCIKLRPGDEKMQGSDATKSDLKMNQEIQERSDATSKAINSKGKAEAKEEVSVYSDLRLASL
ncbi:hypothetical protein AXG93_1032s1010 [Marchantia polymorpha subsp. ruderalis]|uniref:Uncharacterized protein n=1 Tax=Marchantia polymorpha subsp. ruderalis TaxID=1480154 RepID=A0A176VTY4_MARPO|nr:hypothetical protein AXG93_1032s1010 [Marchantia polymorpha subsp. ruderalis]